MYLLHLEDHPTSRYQHWSKQRGLNSRAASVHRSGLFPDKKKEERKNNLEESEQAALRVRTDEIFGVKVEDLFLTFSKTIISFSSLVVIEYNRWSIEEETKRIKFDQNEKKFTYKAHVVALEKKSRLSHFISIFQTFSRLATEND